jgi:hypothetical protein
MTDSQKDFCSGVSLLYMGPDGEADKYIQRMRTALATDDADEAEHVSALMLLRLNCRNYPIRELSERWTREFH